MTAVANITTWQQDHIAKHDSKNLQQHMTARAYSRT